MHICTQYLCSYTIQHVDYMTNSMHTRALPDKMPYEMIHQEKPYLHNAHTQERSICENQEMRQVMALSQKCQVDGPLSTKRWPLYSLAKFSEDFLQKKSSIQWRN